MTNHNTENNAFSQVLNTPIIAQNPELDSVLGFFPATARFIPVLGKNPSVNGGNWQSKTLTATEAIAAWGVKRVPSNGARFDGLGVVLGGDIVAIDHDGPSCEQLVESLSGMSINDALPSTLTITSGKPGRYQKLYILPAGVEIAHKVIKTGVTVHNAAKGRDEHEQLEIRKGDSKQSVVWGSHPETGAYSVMDFAPIAPLPEWLCELAKPAEQSTHTPAPQLAYERGFTGDLERFQINEILGVLSGVDFSPSTGTYSELLKIVNALTNLLGDSEAISIGESLAPKRPRGAIASMVRTAPAMGNPMGALVNAAKGFGYSPSAEYRRMFAQSQLDHTLRVLGRGAGRNQQHGVNAIAPTAINNVPWQLRIARGDLANTTGRFAPSVIVNTGDLSEANLEIPESGVVVVDSSMGTGKTKLIEAITRQSPEVLALTPRISLGRGLAARLDLDYIDNCDAVGRHYISNGVPTYRLSACVHSVLKFGENYFTPGGYVLVLDECDQTLNALLRSLLCNKDGVRSLRVARFEFFIKNAKLVIVASATLNRDVIEYIMAVWNEGREIAESPYIIKNTFNRDKGLVTLYSGTGVDGSQKAAKAEVLRLYLDALSNNKKLAIPCDTKVWACELEKIADRFGNVLSVHGDNSHEHLQQQLIANPDQFLESGDLNVVYSPSIGSGVSIESDYFDEMIGFYDGQSISPLDAVQQIGRVRKPINRTIYAARMGRYQQVKDVEGYELVTAYQAVGLAEHLGQPIDLLDSNTPAYRYIAARTSAENLMKMNFAAYLQAGLERDGYRVVKGDALGVDNETATAQSIAYHAWKDAKKQVKKEYFEGVANAEVLTHREFEDLIKKINHTKTERLKLEKYLISDFYKIDDSDDKFLKLVKFDNKGKKRKEIKRLESLLWDGLAKHHDRRDIERMNRAGVIYPSDLPTRSIYAENAPDWTDLGEHGSIIPDVIAYCIALSAGGQWWDKNDAYLIGVCDVLKANPVEVKAFTGFSIHPNMDVCQIVGMILDKYGIKTDKVRCGDGARLYRYQVHQKRFTTLKHIILTRAGNHTANGFHSRQHPLTEMVLGGVDGIATDADSGGGLDLDSDVSDDDPGFQAYLLAEQRQTALV